MSINSINDRFIFNKSSCTSRDYSIMEKRCEDMLGTCFSRISSYEDKVGLVKKDLEIILERTNKVFSLNACAVCEDETPCVRFGGLLMIDPNNIPLRFKINDFNDGRLENKDFIDDFITWSNDEYFKMDGLNLNEVTKMDRVDIKRFLVAANNPEQFGKAVEFIFGHELAHVFHKHTDPSPLVKSGRKIAFSALTFASLMGTLGAIIPRSKIMKIMGGVFGSLLGSAFGASLVFCYIFNRMKKLRNNEKDADLFSVKALGTVSGATYYFDNAIQSRNKFYNLTDAAKVKEISKFLTWMYCVDDHPIEEERIAYVAASDKNIPIAELGYFPSVPLRLT